MAKHYGFNSMALKSLLDATGISIHRLSEITGISETSLIHYCNGKADPGIDNLIKLADFFAVPLDYLAGRCDQETAEKVLTDYPGYFEQLRRAPYEWYLYTKREKVIEKYPERWCAPYPYNLVDNIFMEPTSYILTDDQLDGLEYALSTLSQRERDVLHLRYHEALTLEDTGARMGPSGERIRQIEVKAIRKLRHPSRANYIRNGLKGHELKAKVIKLEAWENELNEYETQLEEKAKYLSEKAETYELESKEELVLSTTPLAMLGLSVRAYNVLLRGNCDTLDKIIEHTKDGSIMNFRGCGKGTVKEIVEMVYHTTGLDYSSIYPFMSELSA